MCDYSLEHVASRPAKVGDKLVTTRFKDPYAVLSHGRGSARLVNRTLPFVFYLGTEPAFDREIEVPAASSWAGFGACTRTNTIGITTRLSCPRGKPSCSLHCAKGNTQRCFNCRSSCRGRTPRRSRAKQSLARRFFCLTCGLRSMRTIPAVSVPTVLAFRRARSSGIFGSTL